MGRKYLNAFLAEEPWKPNDNEFNSDGAGVPYYQIYEAKSSSGHLITYLGYGNLRTHYDNDLEREDYYPDTYNVYRVRSRRVGDGDFIGIKTKDGLMSKLEERFTNNYWAKNLVLATYDDHILSGSLVVTDKFKEKEPELAEHLSKDNACIRVMYRLGGTEFAESLEALTEEYNAGKIATMKRFLDYFDEVGASWDVNLRMRVDNIKDYLNEQLPKEPEIEQSTGIKGFVTKLIDKVQGNDKHQQLLDKYDSDISEADHMTMSCGRGDMSGMTF